MKKKYFIDTEPGEVDKYVWIFWKRLLLGIYFYSGLQFIVSKQFPQWPQHQNRRFPTLLVWLVGLYIAAYSLASNRYETRVDRLELRTSMLMTQLSTPGFQNALEMIPNLQKTKIPIKPDLWNPKSIVLSLSKSEKLHWENIYILKNMLVSFRTDRSEASRDLSGINLQNADLSGISFGHANLKNAWLQRSDLKYANLWEAILEGAELEDADLDDAFLKGANLKKANLRDANLKNAYLKDVDLSGADLSNATWINGIRIPESTICQEGSIGRCISPSGRTHEIPDIRDKHYFWSLGTEFYLRNSSNLRL